MMGGGGMKKRYQLGDWEQKEISKKGKGGVEKRQTRDFYEREAGNRKVSGKQ